MRIELVAVIEIAWNNHAETIPEKYPYWDNPEIWDAYHDRCHRRAGVKDKLTPYLKGAPFYRLADISEHALTILTIEHTLDSCLHQNIAY